MNMKYYIVYNSVKNNYMGVKTNYSAVTGEITQRLTFTTNVKNIKRFQSKTEVDKVVKKSKAKGLRVFEVNEI